MNEIVKVFNDRPVRIITEEGEPRFVGKDVCLLLGYRDSNNAMKQHCRGVVKYHPIVDSLGREQNSRILTEPDVMRLICGSKLPEAVRFEKWVFEEVLPSIRKTGAYVAPNLSEEALKNLIASIEEQYHFLIQSNASLHEELEYLRQFKPKAEYGEVSKLTGKEKTKIRCAPFVSGRGKNPKRLDPAISGFLQLDLFREYLPQAIFTNAINIITINNPQQIGNVQA